jgi:hypothetical protein
MVIKIHVFNCISAFSWYIKDIITSYLRSTTSHTDRAPGAQLFIRHRWLFLRGVDCVWNVMAHAQKPNFVFRRNGRVHTNRRGRQFSRLLAAEVYASAIVMLDLPCSEVVWRVLATHSIRQFPLHFPSCASPCAIASQLDSTMAEDDHSPSSARYRNVWHHTYNLLCVHDVHTAQFNFSYGGITEPVYTANFVKHSVIQT